MNYKKIVRLLPSYRLSKKRIDKFSRKHLLTFVERAKRNVPFYNGNQSYENNFENFPILRKSDVIERENDFLSKKHWKLLLKKSATGGTSGTSLNLFRNVKDLSNELAYVDYAFSLIGNKLKIAVLRGNKINAAIGYKKDGLLFLSSYNLSDKTIRDYLSMIRLHKINCIHAYPSSLLILIKLIDYNNLLGELMEIKGILTSSEVMSLNDREYIKLKLPHIKLIDLYGQNEHVSFALAVDLGPYKFFNCYGYTEFVYVESENDNTNIAEIVSTGLSNDAMPLIRYGTEDYVKVDYKGNVISIIGRAQDYLYDVNNEKMPCTVLTRPSTLKNVLNFQFSQEQPGYVEFRVVVNKEFGENDVLGIMFDFNTTFNNRIKASVQVYDTLERTKAGKIKRLVTNIIK